MHTVINNYEKFLKRSFGNLNCICDFGLAIYGNYLIVSNLQVLQSNDSYSFRIGRGLVGVAPELDRYDLVFRDLAFGIYGFYLKVKFFDVLSKDVSC